MFKKILNYWHFFIANVMYVTLHFCDLSVCTRWMGSGSGENHNVSWAGSGLLWYGVWGQRKGRCQRWTWDQSGHQDCKWIRQYAWTHRVLERSFSYEGVQLSPCGKNEGKSNPESNSIQILIDTYISIISMPLAAPNKWQNYAFQIKCAWMNGADRFLFFHSVISVLILFCTLV